VLVNVVAANYVLPASIRVQLMRLAGLTVGEATVVKSRCTFAGPAPVSIGSGCYIGFCVTFDASGAIEIADHVNIAQGVSVVTATHEIGNSEQRASTPVRKPVRIGAGCWLGAAVTVLPGVTIGDGCVIAAGSVVTADCAPDGLYGGIPARRIRDLDDPAGRGDADPNGAQRRD
jgi:maltose O-acetyltransferase